MRELQDLSPMPWGSNTGTPMRDVPVGDLHWLWTTGDMRHDYRCPVADYIRRNLHRLKAEYKVGNWS